MAGWISEETRRQNGQIEPRAAVCLADMVGEDTRVAAQEIAKLLTYVNLGRPITVQDVEHVSVVTAQESIFALVDALGNKNGHEAQRVLHRLLEEADPFELWGMVIRQFRLLLLAREIIEASGSARQIQDALRLRDFAASKVYKQARQFSMPALEAIYHRLLEIDEGAKTSQVTLELALDMFIVEIVRQP
jgi:DNA polymerase-3 subunit delta